MSTVPIKEEAIEVARSAEGARAAIEREDWGVAERMLTEVQDRVARLMREVGDRGREAMMVSNPDPRDRG